MLNYFMDFLLGEIDEIENVLISVDPYNHSEMALSKIQKLLVVRQLIAVAARVALLE